MDCKSRGILGDGFRGYAGTVAGDATSSSWWRMGSGKWASAVTSLDRFGIKYSGYSVVCVFKIDQEATGLNSSFSLFSRHQSVRGSIAWF
jgi:hypothetical protein